MTELFLTNDTSDKLTPEILAQLNLKFNINFERDGYSISTKDDSSIVYGFYDDKHSQIYSIYPGRSTGDWINILKLIDMKVKLQLYDDKCNDFLCKHYDINSDKCLSELMNNIKILRKKLHLD